MRFVLTGMIMIMTLRLTAGILTADLIRFAAGLLWIQTTAALKQQQLADRLKDASGSMILLTRNTEHQDTAAGREKTAGCLKTAEQSAIRLRDAHGEILVMDSAK